MRIAVPHAPCDRRIGFRQLLEHRGAVHWRQVEPAIGHRQENAKKPSAGEVAREIFRQPSGCFDSVALRDNARPEIASSRKKGGAVRRIVHHYPHQRSDEACCLTTQRQSRPVRYASAGRSPIPITASSRSLSPGPKADFYAFSHPARLACRRAYWRSFVNAYSLDCAWCSVGNFAAYSWYCSSCNGSEG